MGRRVGRISGGGLLLHGALGAALVMIALSAPSTSLAAGTGGIKGAITGPGSVPISEVWACAYSVEGEEFEESCDLTGSSGTYSIPELKAGKYKVEFWSESTEPSYVGEFYDDKPFWEEANEVEVKEGVVTTGIDAELAEGGTIEGEIRAASLGGPVEEALVCAQLPPGEPEGCTLARSDGTYTLSGLPAGEYKVQFIPATFLYNLLNQFYDHKSTWTQADLLTVAEGETKTGIDADLEAGAEIRGTVYSSATGAPVADVLVCAFFKEEGEDDWLLRECSPTSSMGTYALLALSTEPYKVVFSPEFKEFFGEEVFEDEDDGFLTQYFDHKTTLAAADPLSLIAPEVRTGIDANLQPKTVLRPAPPITPLIAGPAPRHRHRKHCRPGFRRKKVAGKRRCVKVHKHRRHHRQHPKPR